MKPANFSREILERRGKPRGAPVSGNGWSDWGNPERILQTLKRLRSWRQSRMRPLYTLLARGRAE